MKIKQNGVFKGRNFEFPLGTKTYIMGILNITPDSFSDGGLYFNADSAIRRAVEMQKQGADLIDIGAMSTRPGSERISVKQELERLSCLAEISRNVSVPVSVDTFNPETARFALENGASVINDVSGRFYPEMAALVKQYRCGYVIMHNQNDRAEASGFYPNGVTESVNAFFDEMLEHLCAFGIEKEYICMDPGYGFAKNTAENLDLLKNQQRLKREDICLLTALSKKRFIGELTETPNVQDRLSGSLAGAVAAIQKGADILRVHDVAETVQAAKLADAVYR